VNLPVIITAALESALNRYIELDPDGMANMARLQGKVIAIDILGLDMSLFIIPADQHIHVMSHYDAEADTRLRGAPFSLLKMGLGQNSENALFSGDVEIVGNTEAGQQFNQILQQLDIDWEEHLSHITGDVIAHQLGRGLRGLLRWGRQVEDSLLQDTAEYLEEEKQLVATKYEVEAFNHDVDIIRNDIERLQARVQRLLNKADTHNNNNTEHQP
jgi:ubiquinone biosynthesis protein UbiJ